MDIPKKQPINRVRQALDRIYDNEPPQFQDYLERYRADPTSRIFAPLAEGFRRAGRVDEAIQMCQFGLKHHPDFHSGRVALAKCYMEKGLYSDARAELEKVIQVTPDNLLAQKLLGNVSEKLKEYELAVRAYKMANVLAPEDLEITESIDRVTLLLQKSKQAMSSTVSTLSTTTNAPIENPTPPTKEPTEIPDGLLKKLNHGLAPLLPLSSSSSPAEDTNHSIDTPDAPLQTEDFISTLSVQELLGLGPHESNEELFTVQPLKSAFEDAEKRELTSETLGDLYYSQSQYDQALRIYEALYRVSRVSHLLNKMESCRARLGVDETARLRNRKVETLRTFLKRVQTFEVKV